MNLYGKPSPIHHGRQRERLDRVTFDHVQFSDSARHRRALFPGGSRTRRGAESVAQRRAASLVAVTERPESAGRDAAERATRVWVRVKANMNLRAYDIFEAESTLTEPEWPELGYWDLIKIAFRDHLITDLDHAVIKRLRGLT